VKIPMLTMCVPERTRRRFMWRGLASEPQPISIAETQAGRSRDRRVEVAINAAG